MPGGEGKGGDGPGGERVMAVVRDRRAVRGRRVDLRNIMVKVEDIAWFGLCIV